MKHLCVVLLTYGGHPARREYAYETLRSCLDHLKYSGPLSVHIADDGSPKEHRSVLREIAGCFPVVERVSISNSDHNGYGANWNAATQVFHLHADVALVLEDDWRLARDLDADALVAALGEEIACIRLGYLGSTQELRGRIKHTPTQTVLLFDPDSPEPHVFAGHPRIETVEFERSVGPWPTYLPDSKVLATPGETEFMVCHRRASRHGVAWPLDLHLSSRGDLFEHIGAVRSEEEEQNG